MAQSCQVCGRKPLNSARRSHSNIKTKHRQKINLQSMIYDGKKVKACPTCKKSQFKS